MELLHGEFLQWFSVSQEFAIRPWLQTLGKAGWAGLIICGLLPHVFLSRRLDADGRMVREAGADLPPRRQETSAGGTEAPGVCLSLTLASLQQILPFWYTEETVCVGSAKANRTLIFQNENAGTCQL